TSRVRRTVETFINLRGAALKNGPFLLLIAILFAVTGSAQTARLSGTVIDPSGALVAGTDVALIGPGNTPIAAAKTGPDGMFAIDAAPGSYALEVSAEGFEKVVQGISIGTNNKPLTVTLSVAKITQEVEVQENANQISIDPENNQTALVLKEDDIQSLPDD